ncbi:uncharacterized protein [Physeter macrocephalus]|uniref:Uncharacterized protein n=1 Tax=Physeter macrocephalus TaxID=9755 RepID=A0A2Y9T238_PHYMC|nr:uncharacterized protein LOC112065880 [Physeter catodon]|eukprot:XP_023982910.2 uncharacterized protein LOC112065880 [Physeter catodon]
MRGRWTVHGGPGRRGTPNTQRREDLGRRGPPARVNPQEAPLGETLRPVWGLMDKCYPVTAQRRRVRSGEKHSLQAMTPKATGGLNDAAPKEETDTLSLDEGEMRSPGEEAGSPIPSPIPAGKEVSEEEEVAGTPGWEENKTVRKEIAAYTSEASEVDLTEERPGGRVPQLLRKLWPGWCPASDNPQDSEPRMTKHPINPQLLLLQAWLPPFRGLKFPQTQ